MIRFLREQVWAHLPQTVTRRQCVREAFVWGGVFGLIGWLGHHRGHEAFGWGFGGLGVFLALTLPIPGLGERVYLSVLRVAGIFGFVVARVGLTLAFYLVVTPFGIALRTSGKDPLDLKFRGAAPPAWKPHTGKSDARQYYRLS